MVKGKQKQTLEVCEKIKSVFQTLIVYIAVSLKFETSPKFSYLAHHNLLIFQFITLPSSRVNRFKGIHAVQKTDSHMR